MIETTTWIWLAVGLLAGSLHATMLWRTVHRLSAWLPLIGLLRLGLVATLLVVAAINGQVLAGAAGWAIGLLSLATWFMTRRASRVPDQGKANHGISR